MLLGATGLDGCLLGPELAGCWVWRVLDGVKSSWCLVSSGVPWGGH